METRLSGPETGAALHNNGVRAASDYYIDRG